MKYVYIIVIMFLLSIKVAAEVISSSLLAGTTWEEVDLQKKIIHRDTISFSSSTLIKRSFFPRIDMTVEKQFDYYLSDNVPECFDSTLVGTETRGNYLVTYCKKPRGMSYCEIRSLDLNTGDLYLYFEMRPGVIGGRDITTHYKFIK